MRYTNKFQLPGAIVAAIENDPYTKGTSDFSVTELLDPPQIRHLRKKHDHELEKDISDSVESLFGQAMHSILERAEIEAIAERRLVGTFLGKTISGGMDRFERLALNSGGLLTDYKTTSVFTAKNGPKAQWTEQLNCYAEILRQHGENVTELEIVVLYRDWRIGESRSEAWYPPKAEAFKIEVWSPEQARKFITERLMLHLSAEAGQVPPCTDEERWKSEAYFSAVKAGNKKASPGSGAPNETAVKAWIATQDRPGSYTVKQATAQYRRCAGNYCNVAQFCETWNKDKNRP